MAPFTFVPRRPLARDARAWNGVCGCDFEAELAAIVSIDVPPGATMKI